MAYTSLVWVNDSPTGEDTRTTPHSTGSHLQLPGFGKPLDFLPTTKNGDPLLFPNALVPEDIMDGYIDMPLTSLREFGMLRFMNTITDKSGWEAKVFDEEITKKWIDEALSSPHFDMTPNMARYCIAELQHKATLYKTTKCVSVCPGDVVKSDTIIPAEVQKQLKAATAALENIPESHKDWHPGSDGKVLDLVHPSLFPLVYGYSKILPNEVIGLEDCLRRAGEGIVIPIPRWEWGMEGSFEGFSTRFQWLPCDVAFTNGGHGELTSKIVSYINNLHPVAHENLYPIIEQIIDYAIPMWNLSLTKYTTKQRIKYTACEYDVDPEKVPESEWPQQSINESRVEFYDRLDRWKASVRVVKLPDADAEFSPPPVGDRSPEWRSNQVVNLKGDFRDRGLQVIVKLANIHLTPESPEYSGGTWHVEGQLNEHICASAIYYYDSENITPSHLSFRQHCDSGDFHAYPQDEHSWFTAVFGLHNRDPAVQEIGDILALPGRLVTFPNILQHRVKPFCLSDRSKPGHRKILALFLVDPNIRVISTANVPPQQQEWWAWEVMQLRDCLISNFPPELQSEIVMQAQFPIELGEARRLREELMVERGYSAHTHRKEFEYHRFSLCEH